MEGVTTRDGKCREDGSRGCSTRICMDWEWEWIYNKKKKKLTAFFLFSGVNTRRMVSEFDLVIDSFV